MSHKIHNPPPPAGMRPPPPPCPPLTGSSAFVAQLTIAQEKLFIAEQQRNGLQSELKAMTAERDQLKSWQESILSGYTRSTFVLCAENTVLKIGYDTNAQAEAAQDALAAAIDERCHAPLDEDDNSPSDLDYDPPPEHCGGTIEDGRPQPLTSSPPKPAGPWTCEKCGQVNSSWGTECGRCDALPPAPLAGERCPQCRQFLDVAQDMKDGTYTSKTLAEHQADRKNKPSMIHPGGKPIKCCLTCGKPAQTEGSPK